MILRGRFIVGICFGGIDGVRFFGRKLHKIMKKIFFSNMEATLFLFGGCLSDRI